MRPWRPIVGPAGERCYYFSLRCGMESASIRVTDFCDWWSCDLGRPALEDQQRVYGVQTSLDELLRILVRCFEETEASDAYSFELAQVYAVPEPKLLLRLELTDSMKLEFPCERAAEAERAIRVRDELVVPALLTLEQLDCSAPESAVWEPPSGTAPMPSFRRAGCQQIFSWALAQAGLVVGVPDVDTGVAHAKAASAPEPSPAAVVPAVAVDPSAEIRKAAVRKQREEKAAKDSAKRAKADGVQREAKN